MAIGRPKSDEQNLTLRLKNETVQLLAALATAAGETLEHYVINELDQHLVDKKNDPILANWYKVNYPILELATPPKKGKKT